MSENDKHPVSGIVSVVMTGIGLIMLLISLALGMNQKVGEDYSTSFVVYLFISMTIATIGSFSALMGLVEEDVKKIFPIIGLFLGVICVGLVAVIIISP
jgi:formate hydrogenlyase subunit 3/multisubunit Na+/H+ antiporter MnhD subunit